MKTLRSPPRPQDLSRPETSAQASQSPQTSPKTKSSPQPRLQAPKVHNQVHNLMHKGSIICKIDLSKLLAVFSSCTFIGNIPGVFVVLLFLQIQSLSSPSFCSSRASRRRFCPGVPSPRATLGLMHPRGRDSELQRRTLSMSTFPFLLHLPQSCPSFHSVIADALDSTDLDEFVGVFNVKRFLPFLISIPLLLFVSFMTEKGLCLQQQPS